MTRRYEKKDKKATEELFCKWARELSDTAADIKRQEQEIRVVPSPFCWMHYTKDSRYVLRGESSMKTNRLSPKTANVDFRA